VLPHTFPAVHEQLLRRYRNAMLQPGKAAAALRLQCLAGGPHWSSDELAAALEQVKGVAEVQVRSMHVDNAQCVLHSIALAVTGAEMAGSNTRASGQKCRCKGA
jgi:hypothetical protein